MGLKGRIALVGAGPGDPSLLTMAAYKALQEADLVIADQLIPEAILELVQGELKIAPKKRRVKHQIINSDIERFKQQPLNKDPAKRGNIHLADRSQNQLDEWVLNGLAKGLYVIRLKNGDPFLYGRGGEEIEVFRTAGYEAHVIPGISSCLAAPVAAGISPTLRDVADQIFICTGHGKHGSIPSIPPYDPKRTTIFLMAISRLENLSKSLIEVGYPSNLPFAIVQEATLPTQVVVQGTISNMYNVAEANQIRSPATLIIGNVVAAANIPLSPIPSSLEDTAMDQKKKGKKTSLIVASSIFQPNSTHFSLWLSLLFAIFVFPFSLFILT